MRHTSSLPTRQAVQPPVIKPPLPLFWKFNLCELGDCSNPHTCPRCWAGGGAHLLVQRIWEIQESPGFKNSLTKVHAHAFIQPPSSSIESNSTGNTVLPSLHCQLLHSRKISCKTYEVLSYLTLIPHLTARTTHSIFRLQCQQRGFFKAAAAVSRGSRKQNISASFISSKKPAAVSAADRSTLQAVTNILYRKLSLTAVRLVLPPRPPPLSSWHCSC